MRLVVRQRASVCLDNFCDTAVDSCWMAEIRSTQTILEGRHSAATQATPTRSAKAGAETFRKSSGTVPDFMDYHPGMSE